MDDTSHSESTALQQCVHDVQRQCAEHEHEFQRLGNAGEEYSQCGGDEHGLILCTLVSIDTAVHCQCDTQQQTGSTDHLANLEAGRSNSCEQVGVSGHIAGLLEVDEVVDPCQPQRVLTKYLRACVYAGGNCIRAAERGVVHWDGQHVMQAERQQQTFQRTIDERSQNRRRVRRIGNPDTEVIDAGLNNRPEQGKYNGDDHGISDDHHRNKALAVEEGQCVRQLAEVVVFIVSYTADKT